MIAETETYWHLITNLPHWELELTIMLLFDGLVGALLWPRAKRWWQHHKEEEVEHDRDDERIESLENDLRDLKAIVQESRLLDSLKASAYVAPPALEDDDG